MEKTIRSITAFDPVTEWLVSEYEFDENLVDELRPLFDVGDDYHMVFVYPVTDDVKDQVARITGIPLTGPYDYFVEAHAPE